MASVRAAVHVHSDWSYDGHLPLPELAQLFRRHGYDAVFMCEHDRGFTPERMEDYVAACRRASAGGALLIPGIEYADAEDRVHVPVWGAVPFLGEGVPTGDLLWSVRAHGGVSVLAHPVRREARQVVDQRWLELCTGIEIWTRKWDGFAPNPQAVRWARAHGLVEIVSLDLHRRNQTFPLAMELELAGPLAVAACVEAIQRGSCRPLIGPVPVAHLSAGVAAPVARLLERLRRPVWRQARRVRDRRRFET